MAIQDKVQSHSREELRNHAVNEMIKKHPKAFHNFTEDGARKLMEEFIKAKLADFPNLCKETRRVNWLKEKELRAVGNEKGWSKSKNFKMDYVIPRDLYLFMINMVYRDFWAEDNEKVWRSFLKAVCRGDDSTELLRRVKVYYGAISKQA